MRALLLVLLMLLPAGCVPVHVTWPGFREPAPPPPVRLVTCGDLNALAAAVVDGRRRGQSRAEQRLLVETGGPAEAFHRGVVEAVYDWPRPITGAGWAGLSETTVAAANLHCLNRPAATLRGERRG